MSEVTEEKQGDFVLLLFAAASTYCGAESLSLAAPMTIGEIFEHLEQKFPGITKKILDSSAVTVNLDYIDLEDKSKEGMGRVCDVGDEVGIIPPVSSG